MDEGRNMILLFPSLIKFKNDEAKSFFKPRYDGTYMELADAIADFAPVAICFMVSA
jgi:hypothetical protein